LSFARQDVRLSREPTDVADFNENGKPDLVANRTVLLDGTSQVPLAADPLSFVIDLDAADYNRDGHQDVLLATALLDEGGRVTSSSLDLYHGNGRGQFVLAERLNIPNDPNGFQTGDLDRDGRARSSPSSLPAATAGGRRP
jgi:hypothetical protein